MDITIYQLLQEILPYFIVCFLGIFIYLTLLSVTYHGAKLITDMQKEFEKQLDKEKEIQKVRESASLARVIKTSSGKKSK